MLPTPEETAAELQSPAPNDAIQQLDGIYALTRRAVGNVIDAEDDGTLDPDAADEAIEDILANQLELQSVALSIPLQELAEEVERIVEVGSPAESFGQAFTMLLAEEHDSLEDGLAMVSEHTGIDQSTLIDYANDNDTPDPDTAMAIGSCFQCCDDDPSALDHLVSLASDMADYSAQNQLTAEFAALANERAEFARTAQIQHRLKAVERLADELYNNNYITPDQRRRIMPLGLEADDRADFSAFFSQTAAKLGTSAEQYLDCIEFTLNFLRDGGQQSPTLMTDFSMYQAPEPIDQSQAAEIAKYRSTHGYS